MLKSKALKIVGGLSAPSKMPCPGYSIPAQMCIKGSILAKIGNTICSKCYALKGRYMFPVVLRALERRYAKLMAALANPIERIQFVSAFQTLLGGWHFFRWHDSGDLQSVEHLDLIASIARATPHTMHWLPTRELAIVRAYKEISTIPPNLIIRLSATNIGQNPLKWGGLTSTVHYMKKTAPAGFICEANTRGGKCGPCRACWNPGIQNVSYPFH